MTRRAKDEEREERIHMEIIVDAYGPEEQAMGWYNFSSVSRERALPDHAQRRGRKCSFSWHRYQAPLLRV